MVADEAYIEFCPQASLAGWLAEYPHGYFAHTVESFLLWRGFVADLRWQRRSHQPADESDRPYPLSTPVADIAAGVKPGDRRHARTGGANYCRTRIPDCRTERDPLRGAGFDSETNYILARFKKPPAQCLNLCGIGALSYVIRINNPL